MSVTDNINSQQCCWRNNGSMKGTLNILKNE